MYTVTVDKYGSMSPKDYGFVRDNFPFKAYNYNIQQQLTMFERIGNLKMRSQPGQIFIKNMDRYYSGNIIVIDGTEYNQYDILPETIASIESARLHTQKTYIRGVKNDNPVSIMELWQKNSVRNKVIQNAVRYSRNRGQLTAYDIRESLYHLYKNYEATEFKVGIAAMFYDYYQAKVVFDPCMGRGPRMIAALAKGIQYYGVDPSKWTPVITNDIIERFRPDVNIVPKTFMQPFEDFDLSNVTDSVDLIFTSPPYDDYEIYETNNPEQLCSRYKTTEQRCDVIKGWMDKCYSILMPGGRMVLSMNDAPTKNVTNAVLEHCQDIGFHMEAVFATAHKSKDGSLYNYQPFFVFRR